MTDTQRQRQIGVLRSLSMTRRQGSLVIAGEAALMSLLGSAFDMQGFPKVGGGSGFTPTPAPLARRSGTARYRGG